MQNISNGENRMENDITWMDILALDVRIKRKLKLETDDIALEQEDIELINTSDYVDLDQLKAMMDKACFTNTAIEQEIGISKAHYSMVFGNSARKNKRGMRMRVVVAILNAIRRRKIYDSFSNILVRKEK